MKDKNLRRLHCHTVAFKSDPIKDFISKQSLPVHVGITGPLKITSLIKFANIVGAKLINFIKSNATKALDLLRPSDPNDLINKVKGSTNYFIFRLLED